MTNEERWRMACLEYRYVISDRFGHNLAATIFDEILLRYGLSFEKSKECEHNYYRPGYDPGGMMSNKCTKCGEKSHDRTA